MQGKTVGSYGVRLDIVSLDYKSMASIYEKKEPQLGALMTYRLE